jgi:hypothetical protein
MRTVRGSLMVVLLAGGGLGLASCGGGKPASMASQIKGWSVGAGFAELDQSLVADFPAVRAGVAGGDLKALKTACAGLTIDAGNIYDTLVTPDPSLTNALARSLTGLAGAGSTCNRLTVDTTASTGGLRRMLAVNETLYSKARSVILAAGGG